MSTPYPAPGGNPYPYPAPETAVPTLYLTPWGTLRAPTKPPVPTPTPIVGSAQVPTNLDVVSFTVHSGVNPTGVATGFFIACMVVAAVIAVLRR